MFGRIDRRYATVVTLIKQTIWGDDAVQVLQRRSAGCPKDGLSLLWNIAYDCLLERGRRAVGLTSNGIALRLHPFGNVWRHIRSCFGRVCQHAFVGNCADCCPAKDRTSALQKISTRRDGTSLVGILTAVNHRFPFRHRVLLLPISSTIEEIGAI